MTFSIVALDRETRRLGAASSTGIRNVGERVPHVRGGVGAVATQSLTKVSYGREGLKLLEVGHNPKEALQKMLETDPEREHRQVIIIDTHGRKAAFTGEKTYDFKSHIKGENYVVAGNLLSTVGVVKKMAEAFEGEGDFVKGLLSALQAGKEAGGDRRGERSATLVVAPYGRGVLNLRVDDHPEPVKELATKL